MSEKSESWTAERIEKIFVAFKMKKRSRKEVLFEVFPQERAYVLPETPFLDLLFDLRDVAAGLPDQRAACAALLVILEGVSQTQAAHLLKVRKQRVVDALREIRSCLNI